MVAVAVNDLSSGKKDGRCLFTETPGILQKSGNTIGVQPECHDNNICSPGLIQLSVVSLVGEQCEIKIDAMSTVKDLRMAVWKAQGMDPEEQRLIHRGAILLDDKRLCEQGVSAGDVISLVRVAAPPGAIKIEAPSGLKNISGIYIRWAISSDGRPIYHACTKSGKCYFGYDEHSARWVVTDIKSWNDSSEACWAYCSSDAMHPGHIESEIWYLRAGTNSYEEVHNITLQRL